MALVAEERKMSRKRRAFRVFEEAVEVAGEYGR